MDKWAFEILLHTLLDSNFSEAIQGGHSSINKKLEYKQIGHRQDDFKSTLRLNRIRKVI